MPDTPAPPVPVPTAEDMAVDIAGIATQWRWWTFAEAGAVIRRALYAEAAFRHEVLCHGRAEDRAEADGACNKNDAVIWRQCAEAAESRVSELGRENAELRRLLGAAAADLDLDPHMGRHAAFYREALAALSPQQPDE